MFYKEIIKKGNENTRSFQKSFVCFLMNGQQRQPAAFSFSSLASVFSMTLLDVLMAEA